MEQDESLGNNIVSFGESVDEKMAQKVFEKYSEIIDQSFLIEEFLSQEIDANINDEETIKNIREQLVVRAKDILTGFVENGGVSIEEIEDRLAKIKTDVLLLSQVLRSSMENGKRVSLSEIKNFSLEGHMSASNLSSEEKEIMKGIYKRNYESNPELQRILLKSHESSLTSEHSDFSVLRYKGEVTGFYRIDNKAPNEVYFAAFNIDPEFRGGGLGDELMLRNIGQISETKVIHADCAAFERVGAKYIETGFVSDRFYEFAGNPSLHIELDKKKEFSTKSMSKEKFVQEMLEFELKGYTGGVCKEGNYWIAKASNQDAIPMDIIKEHNTVLTRYFKYTLGNEEAWYAVFEEGK
jgi:ribosomal protein S18 acetylase RimI-like enzyme